MEYWKHIAFFALALPLTAAVTPSHVGDLQPGQGYAGDYFTGLRRLSAGKDAPFIFMDAANTGYIVIDGRLHSLKLVHESGKTPNLDRLFRDGTLTAEEQIHGRHGILIVTIGADQEKIPVSVEIS